MINEEIAKLLEKRVDQLTKKEYERLMNCTIELTVEGKKEIKRINKTGEDKTVLHFIDAIAKIKKSKKNK